MPDARIPKPDRGKPWHFKYLTVNHIYYPLAESSGKLYALLKALKEMAESSLDKGGYERKIVERFGGQQEFQFVIPAPSGEPTASEAAN